MPFVFSLAIIFHVYIASPCVVFCLDHTLSVGIQLLPVFCLSLTATFVLKLAHG